MYYQRLQFLQFAFPTNTPWYKYTSKLMLGGGRWGGIKTRTKISTWILCRWGLRYWLYFLISSCTCVFFSFWKFTQSFGKVGDDMGWGLRQRQTIEALLFATLLSLFNERAFKNSNVVWSFFTLLLLQFFKVTKSICSRRWVWVGFRQGGKLTGPLFVTLSPWLWTKISKAKCLCFSLLCSSIMRVCIET